MPSAPSDCVRVAAIVNLCGDLGRWFCAHCAVHAVERARKGLALGSSANISMMTTPQVVLAAALRFRAAQQSRSAAGGADYGTPHELQIKRAPRAPVGEVTKMILQLGASAGASV